MQNVQDITSVATRLSDKDNSGDSSEVVKKLRLSLPSNRVPANSCVHRDDSTADNRDQVTTRSTHPCDRHYFQASLVGEKYLLMDQVEGSSLYRCVNVHTQQELVCKVTNIPIYSLFSYAQFKLVIIQLSCKT